MRGLTATNVNSNLNLKTNIAFNMDTSRTYLRGSAWAQHVLCGQPALSDILHCKREAPTYRQHFQSELTLPMRCFLLSGKTPLDGPKGVIEHMFLVAVHPPPPTYGTTFNIQLTRS
jgi:hypothetical protein